MSLPKAAHYQISPSVNCYLAAVSCQAGTVFSRSCCFTMKKHRPERAEELQMLEAGTREDCRAALLPFVLPKKATRVIPWVLAYKQRTKFVPLLYSSISTAECNQ